MNAHVTGRTIRVPAIVRGRLVDGPQRTVEGRNGQVLIHTIEPRHVAQLLPLRDGSDLDDLHQLSLDEILAFLEATADALDLARNVHLQEALDASRITSGLSEGVLRSCYARVPELFRSDCVRRTVEREFGSRSLDEWEPTPASASGRTAHVRPFGVRCIHILAGNAPTISAGTIIRSAVTRSDSIIKAPSNDPLTAAAIVQTMIELDASHPVARHLSVSYWKGGEGIVENELLTPANLDKIVAWGGYDSIRAVQAFQRPGLDLILFEPKHSIAIVDLRARPDARALADVAGLLAHDIGTFDQETCMNSRVVYLLTGGSDDELALVTELARATHAALQALPADVSGAAKRPNHDLEAELAGLHALPDLYELFCGRTGTGAIILSRESRPVEFWQSLSTRVANLVPVSGLDQVLGAITSATQTVSIYPDTLIREAADRLALRGVQRITQLGRATADDNQATHDGIEPLRRMCRWVTVER